jgi:hypothetical protein
MLATTARRVAENTSDQVNERIRRQTEYNVDLFRSASPQMITRRLAELDEEWDIERWVETMAPSLTLVGLFGGVFVNRKWLILSGVVQAFFLQHAIQGWCPPIPVLRRLGVRTLDEINQERYALKLLRGDFQEVTESSIDSNSAEEVLAAVRR